EAISAVGKSFIGTEYVGNTLEVNPTSEKLVINLTGLDCVTFVENCLTFARCLKDNRTSFEDYKKELEKIRYRDGIIDGYVSRLHYFTDWIYNNQEKEIVKDITQEIGGVVYDKKINFMSTHPKSYKKLSVKNNLEQIKNTEEAINSRNYYYIPKDNISPIYDSLQTGDIIGTTTNIPGLDVTHTGFVYKKEDGGTYFMHASLKNKQVIISDNSLADYVGEDSKKTGIIIARPQEVK
ncbi:MAG: N-acetylmuramoyl-L-alanine amidase-like domain-containing protein, partial [Ignavibacteria bacterium]